MAKPPPLPPRNPSEASLSGTSTSSLNGPRPRADTIHLTPYTMNQKKQSPNHPYSGSGGFDDPRSSSTQSLRPVESEDGSRRTLLLVYIHGFLGDETSFRSFPAHVHNLLSMTLAETHVIHSKIYPRYKSRKNITFARDDFSQWLAPHESPYTDIVLVGHSLGGILAAEVVLIPSQSGSPTPLRHDLLGLVAFDVPFLGIHPGVVGTGIASLFRSPPEDDASPSWTDSISATSELSTNPADPNFNPTYANDVYMSNRTGKLNKAFYFFNKHWGELSKATSEYVTSHLEHGGVLADYPALKRRYDAMRVLEDVDPFQNDHRAKRVRFINYYSASTGRIKERQASTASPSDAATPVSPSMQNLSLQSTASPDAAPSSNPSPRISIEEHRPSGEIVRKSMELIAADPEPEPEPEPVAEQPDNVGALPEFKPPAPIRTTSSIIEFPPLPPLPDPPSAFDESQYPDQDTRNIARKEHQRQVKAHERIKKDHEKTLRDREKLTQKRQKAAQKEQEKQNKEELKRRLTLNPEMYDKQLQQKCQSSVPPKKQKDRKFCSLPPKDRRTGMRDPTWVRVYMEGMDEVVAHTSMFKMSETYAKLVGDTAVRIEDWVKEDATRRAVLEAAAE